MEIEEGKDYAFVVVGEDQKLLFAIEMTGKVHIEAGREGEAAKILCDTLEQEFKSRKLNQAE